MKIIFVSIFVTSLPFVSLGRLVSWGAISAIDRIISKPISDITMVTMMIAILSALWYVCHMVALRCIVSNTSASARKCRDSCPALSKNRLPHPNIIENVFLGIMASLICTFFPHPVNFHSRPAPLPLLFCYQWSEISIPTFSGATCGSQSYC